MTVMDDDYWLADCDEDAPFDLPVQQQTGPPPRRHWLSWALALATVLTLGGYAAALGYQHYKDTRWKRFAVVQKDRVYRSGQLSAEQLAAALDTLKLKTVIALNGEAAGEALLCKCYSVDFHGFAMPDDGLGKPEDFEKVLAILGDSKRHPILVHCTAGVARTGAAIALYRVIHDGWTIDRAIDELRSFEKRGHIEPALRDHVIALSQRLADRAQTALR